MNRPQSDEAIHRYLLGLSSEAECDEIEQYYLTETDGYERVGAGEDELIDDYLDGRLGPDERRGFESHFLNAAQRREKLNFARALRAVVLRIPVPTPGEAAASRRWFKVPAFGWLQWGVAASLAMALFACGLLLLQNRHLSMGLAAPARVERQNLAEQNEELRRELQALQQPSPLATLVPSEPVINAVLSPGLTRSSGGSARISIPPKAHLAKFKLELFTSDYRVYRALIRLAEGEELVSQNNLHPNSHHEVVVLVPTDLLHSGDYQILLAGKTVDGKYEPAATYSFQITR